MEQDREPVIFPASLSPNEILNRMRLFKNVVRIHPISQERSLLVALFQTNLS